MSPEQARGRPTTAGHGRLQRGGGAVRDARRRAAVRGRLGRWSSGCATSRTRRPRSRRRFPRALREVVERALAKDPDERYSDGGAMAAALSASGSPDGAPARRPPGRDRGGRGRRTQPPAPTETASDGDAGRAGDGRTARGDDASTWPAGRTRVTSDPPRAAAAPGPPSRRTAPAPPPALVAVAALLVARAARSRSCCCTGRAAHTTVPSCAGCRAAGSKRGRGACTCALPSPRATPKPRPRGSRSRRLPRRGRGSATARRCDVVLSSGPPPVAVPAWWASRRGGGEHDRGRGPALRRERSWPRRAPRRASSSTQSPGAAASVAARLDGGAVRRGDAALAGADHVLGRRCRRIGRLPHPRPRVAGDLQHGDTRDVPAARRSAKDRAPWSSTSTPARRFGGFELEEGESETRVFTSGAGLYRMKVSEGRDSARWSMTVEDHY